MKPRSWGGGGKGQRASCYLARRVPAESEDDRVMSTINLRHICGILFS
jgi:hypothetical protein